MQERERRVVSSFDRDVPGSRRLTVNPFTAPAGKISGLKGARTRQQTVYFPVLSLFYFLGAGIAQWLEHRTRD